MGRARLFSTEGIVIKRTDFGEVDRILTIYTPDLGKIRAIAKGVRRIPSRLSGHTELFVHSQLLLASGRNLDIVTQAQMIHSYGSLRDDLDRTAFGFYVAETLDCLTEERIENVPVFQLLLKTLERLTSSLDPRVVTWHYLLQMLGLLGYRPEMLRCNTCNQSVDFGTASFSSTVGGVLCQSCAMQDPRATRLDAPAHKYLRLLQRDDVEVACRTTLTAAQIATVEQVLQTYMRHAAERDFKSTRILRLLQAMPGAN